jgi:DNA processing protein
MIDSRMYWVGLNMVKGIGSVRFKALMDLFGDAETAWNASPEAWSDAGLSPKIVESFQRLRKGVSLDQIWNHIQSLGVDVLTWNTEGYPRRLKEIDQPPPVLYIRGSLIPEDEWTVAIVGTRRVTAYGRQVADEVATTLAQNGVTIVSGMARGVDSIAHQAAIQAGGRTIAVLGNGVDLVYPPENRNLAAQIMDHGALISDYALGTKPDGVNFPPRNRIISGLSMAVIIVEAGETSGALITATFAAEQGRDVFAVPGNINAPQSKGANRLIRDGAQPLLSPQDVLEALNLTMVTEHRAVRVALPSDPVEAHLFKILSQEPKHVDEIRTQANMPIETVSATLAMMELKGMVRQVGGMNYVAVRERPEVYEA